MPKTYALKIKQLKPDSEHKSFNESLLVSKIKLVQGLHIILGLPLRVANPIASDVSKGIFKIVGVKGTYDDAMRFIVWVDPWATVELITREG